ncbi:MAG: ankyrin repeat domain-containing protein [Cytophagales bacterium]|nr:MAG: ankyrin repeat domain-containing protein [Cytophagales bacterium]TAH29300.1 MAG: ankyrin repeat domain-containing protein [Cytophagales bacterium]
MGGDWKDMFFGVQNNDFELVRYHICMGVDLNYQHPEFLTSPLIESIRFQYLEMTKYLLDNGAKPDLKEAESNKTPLEIAKLLGYDNLYKLLQQYLKSNE